MATTHRKDAAILRAAIAIVRKYEPGWQGCPGDLDVLASALEGMANRADD